MINLVLGLVVLLLFFFLLGLISTVEWLFKVKVRYPAIRALVLALAFGSTIAMLALGSLGVPSAGTQVIQILIGIGVCVLLLKFFYQLRFGQSIGLFLSLILTFIVFSGISLHLVTTYFVAAVNIAGESMAPQIADGDTIYVQKFRPNYQRNDVVLIKENYNPEHRLLVSRIVGMPGDTIEIQGENIVLNGQPQAAKMRKDSLGPLNGKNILLSPGTYFLISDKPTRALDSRSFGLVPNDGYSLVGKMLFKSR